MRQDSHLIAIAFNEDRFIVEWLAHHLTLGFDEITVYDHESTDETSRILERVGEAYPVNRIEWVCSPNQQPQKSAYNHALERADKEWMAFFDLDEHLVLDDRFDSVSSFLNAVPSDAGAVGVNWLTFGTSGIESQDYGLVRDAFRTGGPRGWGNNTHIKTILRPRWTKVMNIHECRLKEGRYVDALGHDLLMSSTPGKTQVPIHDGAQLNHYQTKSRQDFVEKISRGMATKSRNDPNRVRRNADDFFARLNRNEEHYSEIDKYKNKFLSVYNDMLKVSRANR